VNYALVGAFVLTLGCVLVAGVLWLASGGAWQTQFDVYQAVEEESVAGLNLNAPVKYNGVDVGKVQAIELDHINPKTVNLFFAIKRGTPVKNDTIATLKTQGLTGIAYVELSGGSVASPPLRTQDGAPYPVIRTAPSLSARLENVLSSVLVKLDDTSNNINAMLSKENQAALRSTLADIALITHTVAARQDSIDASLIDAATTLKNTAKASTQLEPLADRLGRAAEAIETMGKGVTKTSLSAGAAVDGIGADVKRFSNESLPELERLLGELSTLSSSLRLLTEQTRRDPKGFIFGHTPVPDGPGESSDKP
jgi:phospholipid/cholesterol/gamma-HCH transport system substrate-binding protein